MKQFSKAKIWLILFTALLLLLAACSGGEDVAEDTSETSTSDAVEEEAAEIIDEETSLEGNTSDDDLQATGSEADSGELPPTPNTENKADIPRATPNVLASADTAVIAPPSPGSRIDSDLAIDARQLDMVFLLDATGSMAYELNSLKARLGDIEAALASLPELDNILIQYGFVVFRDEGTNDPVQLFELTDDWTLFAENLATVTAVGGGDYPESLSEGLYQAITKINWNPEATRLIILFGDAPPHQNMAETVPFEESVSLSVKQNITIFTIGSDGLNEAGITIYQQIAQASNGRFIFISNAPENAQTNATTIQPMTDLPTILAEIVSEVLNEETP